MFLKRNLSPQKIKISNLPPPPNDSNDSNDENLPIQKIRRRKTTTPLQKIENKDQIENIKNTPNTSKNNKIIFFDNSESENEKIIQKNEILEENNLKFSKKSLYPLITSIQSKFEIPPIETIPILTNSIYESYYLKYNNIYNHSKELFDNYNNNFNESNEINEKLINSINIIEEKLNNFNENINKINEELKNIYNSPKSFSVWVLMIFLFIWNQIIYILYKILRIFKINKN